MNNAPERRGLEISELRADADGGTIQGYAAIFDDWSEDLGGFREIIRAGAFKKTIKDGADVRALFNHDPNLLLGRTRSGTLVLIEDNRGLHMTITPPDTEWARGLRESIKRGDVSQSSFAFSTVSDNWFTEDEKPKRELLEVKLFDVSPVTYPAYPQTTVGSRALCGRAGIDYDKLAGIIIKSDRGTALTDEDGVVLAAYIDALSAYLPGEPPQEQHSPEADRFHYGVMRRRLELVELQHGGLSNG